MEEWTEKDVKEVLTNPVYIGLGQYPQIVDPETFIKAGVKAIAEMGAEQYLRQMVDNLLKCIPYTG